jgi:hypothetical protein
MLTEAMDRIGTVDGMDGGAVPAKLTLEVRASGTLFRGAGCFMRRKPEVSTALRPPATVFPAFGLGKGAPGKLRLVTPDYG